MSAGIHLIHWPSTHCVFQLFEFIRFCCHLLPVPCWIITCASRNSLHHVAGLFTWNCPQSAHSFSPFFFSNNARSFFCFRIGDVMRLQIRVGKDGKIEESCFKVSVSFLSLFDKWCISFSHSCFISFQLISQTFGCGSAVASSSLATEWIKGKTLDECMKIKNTDIAQHLALPPVKLHCSMLAEEAIKAAVADYEKKKTATPSS